ncbi:hypothetical protein CALCODRAFT_514778 [Calocera cornea HHB12733]|uniref:Uncharacterized protein n=1 Tax=Calocera cornea HHB12733 TaxID=1353952 RepID=A0A165J7U3_9BASI|nr:hypothetical protein CALCODRAFT_514778 [Calocera cornea HHB12733]
MEFHVVAISREPFNSFRYKARKEAGLRNSEDAPEGSQVETRKVSQYALVQPTLADYHRLREVYLDEHEMKWTFHYGLQGVIRSIFKNGKVAVLTEMAGFSLASSEGDHREVRKEAQQLLDMADEEVEEAEQWLHDLDQPPTKRCKLLKSSS